jgi:putative peptidoglycan lipid II flippase
LRRHPAEPPGRARPARAFNHYFGQSDEADAFNAAFQDPNFLQNLFGEGVLSASFIPVYSRLLAEGDEEESGRIAGAICPSWRWHVGAGGCRVLLTPYLIDVIAPGFHGAKRELTIRLVQILFPARACWSSRPGAWASSTATANSSFPIPRRWSGTWR